MSDNTHDDAPVAAPRRRRRQALVAGIATALLCGSLAGIVLAVRPHGSASTARASVAVVATRPAGSPAVALADVALDGGRALHPGAAGEPPAAPQQADLGVTGVEAGTYTTVRAVVGGRTLSVDTHVVLHEGALTPLLLVVEAHRLRAFWGNQAVDDGLLLAAGKLPTVPDVTFTDQHGRSVPWSSLRGRTVVVAALDTHCHETCPLYTAILQDLERVLRARGWSDRVVVAEVSMDPARDTTAELAAYGTRFLADWELLQTDPLSTSRFWGALHASYARLPPVPGQIDWYTGRQEPYHLHHDSVAFVFDGDGYARAAIQGTPRLGHELSAALAAQLDPASSLPAQDRLASWTITDLLDRVDSVLGEPAEDNRGVEQAARLGRHAPDFTLKDLQGHGVALHDEIGHPVVVNFFATWCDPCRTELPLLAAVPRQHPEVSILAVDEGEDAGTVRPFLSDVLGGSAQAVTALLDGDGSVGGTYAATGLPVSVFLDSDGVVRATHVGQLDATSLAQGLSAAGAGG